MEEENQVDLHEEEEAGEKPQQKQQEHKTLNHHSLYYNFIQRYFTTYRSTHQYLHKHSNGLFVVRVRTDTLPSNPVEIRTVLKVQEVKGKKKKGGTKVHKGTIIAEIVCGKGEVIPVKAQVDGVILEVNQRLDCKILHQPEGYVAVINPGRKFRADPSELQEILLPHQL